MLGSGEGDIERGKGRLVGLSARVRERERAKESFLICSSEFEIKTHFVQEHRLSCTPLALCPERPKSLHSLSTSASRSLSPAPQRQTPKHKPATIAAAANPQAALSSLAKASTVAAAANANAAAAAAAGLASASMAAPAKVDAPAVLADLKMLVGEELRVSFERKRTQRGFE